MRISRLVAAAAVLVWISASPAFADVHALTDAVNVATDQDTGFDDRPVLQRPDGTDAAFVASAHYNSNQGYRTVTGLELRGGKFTLVFNIGTLVVQACSYTLGSELSFAARKDGIAVKATQTTAAPNGEICSDYPPRKPGTRVFTDTYRWNAKTARYAPTTHAIERMEKDAETP